MALLTSTFAKNINLKNKKSFKIILKKQKPVYIYRAIKEDISLLQKDYFGLNTNSKTK